MHRNAATCIQINFKNGRIERKTDNACTQIASGTDRNKVILVVTQKMCLYLQQFFPHSSSSLSIYKAKDVVQITTREADVLVMRAVLASPALMTTINQPLLMSVTVNTIQPGRSITCSILSFVDYTV